MIVVLSVALAALGALLVRSVLRMRRAMRRFEVLNRIAEVSDRGGTLSETLDATCAIIVPEIADFCMIDLIRDGRVERIAVRVGPGGGQKAVDGLAGRRPSLPRAMENGAADRLEPRFIERMAEADLAELAHDRGGPRIPARARRSLGDHRRPQGPGQADRRAHPGRRLVGQEVLARARRVRPRALRPGGADARERRPLLRPGARRRGAGGDRRNAPARAAAATASAHPGLVGGRLLPARRGPRTRSAATSTTPSRRPAAGCS